MLSRRRRHTRCALVTGVQTWALPISEALVDRHQPGGLELGQVARQVALAEPAHGFEEAEFDQFRNAEHGQDRQPCRFVDQPVDGADRVALGRASCRARVWKYVSISVVAVSFNKKTNTIYNYLF